MVTPDQVKGLEFFRGMSLTTVEIILGTAEYKELTGTVFSEGDNGNTMYIIIEGEVEVVRANRKGEASSVIANIGSGCVLGEFALLGETERTATCRVPEGKTAKVLELSATQWNDIKKSEAAAAIEIYKKILQTISARFKRLSEKQERRSFWL